VDPRAVLDDLVEEENSLPPQGKKNLHGHTSEQTIICFVVVASMYIKAGNIQDGWNT
jgi:hypothetical protein